jgi:MYXO-CTERM domain-containing protein
LGGAIITLAQVAVSLLRRHLEAVVYREAAPDPLVYGLFAALGVGAFFGWRRSLPIENIWQRGVIAVLAAVGALLIGFLGAIADRVFGLPGLVAWGAAAAAFGVTGSRWSLRGRAA